MSTKELSQNLLASLYGRSVHSLTLVINGVNKTFRIETDCGNCFLRLYRRVGRSRADIDAELMAIAAARFGVAKPIALAGGGYVFCYGFEGAERQAVLFEEARGNQPAATPESVGRIASELAGLHQRMLCAHPIGRPLAPECRFEQTSAALAALGADFHSLRKEVTGMRSSVCGALQSHAAAQGVCHGDIWPGNVHLAGDRVTFFDFDDCFDGPLVADVARLLGYLWIAQPAQFELLATIVVEGYRHHLPLSTGNWQLMPPLAQLEEIASVGFLARYCSLEPALWAEAQARTMQTLDDWSPNGKAAKVMTAVVFVAAEGGRSRGIICSR